MFSFQGKYILLGVVFTSMLLALPSESRAAPSPCSASNVGEIEYNTSSHDLTWCDGTDFTSMKAGGSPFATCADVKISEGEIEWDDGELTLVFCDGTDAWSMSKNGTGSVDCATGGGGLQPGSQGGMQFNSVDSRYYICDGSLWNQVGP